jgi:hypothetical protein
MSTTRDDLYDRDFFAWTQAQARELRRFARTRPNLPLDLAHLAEEVADLGKEQRAKLRVWTGRILQHLLLLEHPPSAAPRHDSIATILDCRREIDLRLSPTLRRDLARHLPRLYAQARRHAAIDLAACGESEIASRLPETCPYTLEQVLGDWWPELQADVRF